jgi:hypothetical protein
MLRVGQRLPSRASKEVILPKDDMPEFLSNECGTGGMRRVRLFFGMAEMIWQGGRKRSVLKQ